MPFFSGFGKSGLTHFRPVFRPSLWAGVWPSHSPGTGLLTPVPCGSLIPFQTLLFTNFITNPVNRSGNHSCPSGILVVFRKNNSPRLRSDAFTFAFCTFIREADLVVAWGKYNLILIKWKVSQSGPGAITSCTLYFYTLGWPGPAEETTTINWLKILINITMLFLFRFLQM